jgi:hypothetical protein
VVLGARARHAGSQTIGPASSDRFYYSARNHVRFLSRHRHSARIPPWLQFGSAAALELVHALSQRDTARGQAARAVMAGLLDARRGRFGPRLPGSPSVTGVVGPGRGAEAASRRAHNGRGPA